MKPKGRLITIRLNATELSLVEAQKGTLSSGLFVKKLFLDGLLNTKKKIKDYRMAELGWKIKKAQANIQKNTNLINTLVKELEEE